MKRTAKAHQSAAIDRAFTKVVEEALKHIHDPRWLGEHSPLASAYMLSGRLPAPQDDVDLRAPTARGRLLQQIMRATIDACTQRADQWDERWGPILELRYLRERPLSEVQIQEQLALGNTTYHTHRNRALDHLAQQLIHRFRPALRLETPIAPTTLLGRVQESQHCLALLHQGKTINIVGQGGVGKTALGSSLARRFAPNAHFWLTIRPGLNDRLSTVLFALAWFLHGQGASALWSQLVSNRGEVKEQALDLLRSDLAAVSDKLIVLCFDEVDLMRPAEVEAHTELVPLLESLQGLAPLILMGQKSLIQPDYTVNLTGLAAPSAAQLLRNAGFQLERDDVERIHAYTQGNPRLLELVAALYQSQTRPESPTVALQIPLISDLLKTLAATPSLEHLLRRIWHHLSIPEMALIELLAIMEDPAPQDAWTTAEEKAALTQLLAWRLVQPDQRGGITLLPAYRDAIRQWLSGTERERLHLAAGQIRLHYGQHTAAAQHFAAGGEAQLAFQLWEMHREVEIDQGQAGAALSLLQSISDRALSVRERETMKFRRAELRKLLGDYAAAQRELQTAFWRIPFLKAQAQRLQGDIAELRGEIALAVTAYQAAEETIEGMLRQSAGLHRARGYLYAGQRDFTQAQRAVWRIRHDAATLQGVIFDWLGEDSGLIQQEYETALALAQQAGYAYGVANAHLNLGRICGWTGRLSQAKEHLAQAIGYFEMTGNLSKLASAKSNLAVAYSLAEEHEQAIRAATVSLTLFEQVGEDFGIAAGAQILAESHLALGQLDQAESFANRVLQQENANTMPDGLRVLGEIKCQQGHLTDADSLIRRSIELCQENDDKVLEAYAWRALGVVVATGGNAAQARTCFLQAEALFTEARLPNEVAKTQNAYMQ